MLTIYTLTYNEEFLIQFMIDHYRLRFPECNIIIYDNNSTDKTIEIAKNNNCEIRYYNSGNTINDSIHMQIKNNCWKDSKTDWVLICDLDELLDINFNNLKMEESFGNTIIKTEGWTMVNLQDNYDIHNMNYGYRDTNYDKLVLFNKKFINEINYGAGCHQSDPIGNIKLNNFSYILYHYRYINIDQYVKKSMITAQRLSEINKKNNWGTYCMLSETELIEKFQNRRKISVKIR